VKSAAPDSLLKEELPEAVMDALNACDDGTKYCWNPEGVET
jgi:hypothetical protein